MGYKAHLARQIVFSQEVGSIEDFKDVDLVVPTPSGSTSRGRLDSEEFSGFLVSETLPK